MPNLPQGDPKGAEQPKPPRTTEQTSTGERPAEEDDSLDKTIEDSFPASDPPSSIPDPEEDPGENEENVA